MEKTQTNQLNPEAQAILDRALNASHDWYYDRSDDHRTWEKGSKSWAALNQAIDALPKPLGYMVWLLKAPTSFPPPARLAGN